MSELLGLWLPIVVASAAVFFLSFLAWMVLPHHKADWTAAPNEDDVLAALRSAKVPAGQYMLPYCADPKALADPAVKARYEAGPHGTLTIWPGPPAMGGKLGLTFLFYLVVSVFVGYVRTIALDADAPALAVFRVTATVAIMAYSLGWIPSAIWFGKSGRSVVTDLADSIVYALATAAVFAWLG